MKLAFLSVLSSSFRHTDESIVMPSTTQNGDAVQKQSKKHKQTFNAHV